MVKNKIYTKLGVLGIGLLASAMLITGSGNAITAANTKNASASGSWYQLNYDAGTDKLEALFTADLGELASVDSSDLLSMKDAFVNAIGEAAIKDLNIIDPMLAPHAYEGYYALADLHWSPIQTTRGMLTAGAPTGMSTLKTFNAKFARGPIFTAGEFDIDKADAVVGAGYDAYYDLMKVIIDYSVNALFGTTNRAADVSAVATQCATSVNEYITTGWEEAGRDVSLAPTDVINSLFADIATELATAVVEPLTAEEVRNFTAEYALAREGVNVFTPSDFVAFVNVGGVFYDGFFAPLTAGTQIDVKKFLTAPNTDALVQFITALAADKAILETGLNTLGLPELINVANQIGLDNLKDIFQAFGYVNADYQEYLNDNFSALTVSEIISSISGINILGNQIYQNNNLNSQAIIGLLADLPRPSDFVNRPDDEMKFNMPIVIDTSFGTASFGLTVGFFGDCSTIRSALSLISKILKIDYVDGGINIVIDGGDDLAVLLKKLSDSDTLPDSFKFKLFNFFNSTFGEMREKINNATLARLVSLLKGIDYERVLGTLLSADKLNEIGGTSSLTDGAIDALVNAFDLMLHLTTKMTFERFKSMMSKVMTLDAQKEARLLEVYNQLMNFIVALDNKDIDADLLRQLIDPANTTITNEYFYNMIDELAADYGYIFDASRALLDRLFDAVPPSLLNKSIVDYYVGEGTIDFGTDLIVNVEGICNAFAQQYGEEVYNSLDSLIGVPSTINISLKLHAYNFNKVTYVYEAGDELTGILPVGVNTTLYAGRKVINGYTVEKWVDAEGNEVATMPDQDIVLYPQYAVEVFAGEDVIKTYDGIVEQIYVEVVDETLYTYQWYKDGVAINGATEITYDVEAITDNGQYTCEVTRISDGVSAMSDEITVAIDALVVDVTNVKWENIDSFEYDGNEHEVNIDRTTLPEFVYPVYDGDRAATAVGEYTATAKLVSINVSIVLTGEINKTLDWEITKREVALPVASGAALIYTGEEITYPVLGTEWYTVEGNTATLAGDYVATYTLVDTENTYWEGGETDPVTIDWTIMRKTINAGDVHLVQDSFVYTGEEITVELAGVDASVLTAVITSGDKATVPGEYTAVVELTLVDDANYALFGLDELSLDWEILPGTVDVRFVDWSYFGPYEYDGEVRTVSLRENTLDPKITVAYSGDYQATDAGQYTAIATLSLTDANYVMVGESVITLDWEILQKKVYVTPFQWNYDVMPAIEFTYCFEELEVYVLNVPEGAEAYYLGTTAATNVGQYLAAVQFLPVNDNYVIVGEGFYILEWEITPLTIAPEGISWNYEGPFEYNGSEKSVALIDEAGLLDLPYFKVIYNGTIKATDAGTYYVVAEIVSNDLNIEVFGYTIFDLEWRIDPKAIDAGQVAWNYAAPFTYNGQERSVALVNVPEGVQVTYSGTLKASNAGYYNAVAQLKLNNPNYILEGDSIYTVAWEIKKAEISLADVQWNYTSAFNYDRTMKSVAIENGSYAEQLEFVYAGICSAAAAGQYTATAFFQVKAEFAANYIIVGDTIVNLNWEIKKADPMPSYNSDNGVVQTYEVIADGYTLVIDVLDAKAFEGEIEGKVVAYYDVYFKNAQGERVDLNSGEAFDAAAEFIITLNLDAKLAKKADRLVAYDVNDAEAQRLNAKVNEDKLTVNNARLGKLALIENAAGADAANAALKVAALPIGLLAFGVIAVVVFFSIIKGRRDSDKAE